MSWGCELGGECELGGGGASGGGGIEDGRESTVAVLPVCFRGGVYLVGKSVGLL